MPTEVGGGSSLLTVQSSIAWVWVECQRCARRSTRVGFDSGVLPPQKITIDTIEAALRQELDMRTRTSYPHQVCARCFDELHALWAGRNEPIGG